MAKAAGGSSLLGRCLPRATMLCRPEFASTEKRWAHGRGEAALPTQRIGTTGIIPNEAEWSLVRYRTRGVLIGPLLLGWSADFPGCKPTDGETETTA